MILVGMGIVEQISEREFRLARSSAVAEQNFRAIVASQKSICSQVDPKREHAQLSDTDLKAREVGDSSQETPNNGLIAADQAIAKPLTQLNNKEIDPVLMPKISDVKMSPEALLQIHGEGVRSESVYPPQGVDKNE